MCFGRKPWNRIGFELEVLFKKHWLRNGFWIRSAFEHENIILEIVFELEMFLNGNLELELVLH